MDILYHQYKKGHDYGPDHKLTNNWDPDAEYGNEYVKVYFYTDTPTYSQNGFETAEDKIAWFEEADNLVTSSGVKRGCSYEVINSTDKSPYLYIHPMEISGVILKNDVKKIAEAICKAKNFSLRWVELYETVYLMSDEEYEKYLTGRNDEIRKQLFLTCGSVRKNHYYKEQDVCYHVSKYFKLNRLGIQEDAFHRETGQTFLYVKKIAKEMEKEELLVTTIKHTPDGDLKMVRAINKTEQEALGIKISY